MKKILIAITLVLGSFLIYKNNFKEEREEKVLYLETPCAPGTLDPAIADGTYALYEIGKVYESLLTYHYLKRPYEIIPNLAESLPTISEDGLTYTFKIKEGVYFQDNKCFKDKKGRELIAEDFVYSLKRIADPKNQSPLFAFLNERIVGLNEWREENKNLAKTDYSKEVEGIKAIDRYTIQFKLHKRWPQFLMIMCMPLGSVVPKEGVDFYGASFGYHPVGTGPFIIREYKPQENEIVAIKNKKYRKNYYPSEASKELEEKGLLKDAGRLLPFVDKIVTVVIKEDLPRWLKFACLDIDIVNLRGMSNMKNKVINGKIVEELEKKGIVYSSEPMNLTNIMFFNTTIAPFKDNKYLRQAISLALDREKANKLINDGEKIVAKTILPPGVDGYDENFENKYTKRNVEEAKKMLAKAGYPEGKGLEEIEFLVNNNPSSISFAELFKENMREIGINISIKILPWGERKSQLSLGKFQINAGGWLADYPDSENFLSLFYNGHYVEYSGFNNPEFNELYKKATEMQPSDERSELYKTLDNILSEECPGIPLFYEPANHMYYSWVKNFVYADTNISTYYQYIDINLDEKVALKKVNKK